MDFEKTIKFLLKNQARADARFNAKFDRADERFRKAEVRLDRLERVVAQNNPVGAVRRIPAERRPSCGPGARVAPQ
jgi:hypothetical protein